LKKARTQMVVLESFQRWFLWNFVMYTGLFLSVFGLGLYLWFKVLLGEVLNLAGLLSQTFMDLIEKHLQLGMFITIGFIVILMVVAALQALFFSRKIAGPLFSLSKHLSKCQAEGKLKHWETRKGDLFRELVDQFNDLVDQTQGKKGSKN
jgi:methyl-accepting chemotaxis protein